MNTSRKIQIALGTILLWSSTSVSSFASTDINPGKFQSNTVNLPVKSIPSSPLNLTPDTHLIAQNYGDQMYNLARRMDDDNYIPKFEDAFEEPDGQKIILEFCPSQPQDKVDHCWEVLYLWSVATEMRAFESRDFDVLEKIIEISDAASTMYY